MDNTDFDNRTFWDERYRSKPDLGSGLGSRGIERLRKQLVLEMVFRKLRPRTVIDIGCGDFSVSQPLCELASFTAVDVSMAAVRRCRARYPQRFQKLMDVGSIGDRTFDLALCLDVTIHQPTLHDYRNLVGAVLRAADHVVMSGFESRPEGKFASDITFFHQPLTETLESLGGFNVHRLARYRGTTLVAARSPRATVSQVEYPAVDPGVDLESFLH